MLSFYSGIFFLFCLNSFYPFNFAHLYGFFLFFHSFSLVCFLSLSVFSHICLITFILSLLSAFLLFFHSYSFVCFLSLSVFSHSCLITLFVRSCLLFFFLLLSCLIISPMFLFFSCLFSFYPFIPSFLSAFVFSFHSFFHSFLLSFSSLFCLLSTFIFFFCLLSLHPFQSKTIYLLFPFYTFCIFILNLNLFYLLHMYSTVTFLFAFTTFSFLLCSYLLISYSLFHFIYLIFFLLCFSFCLLPPVFVCLFFCW